MSAGILLVWMDFGRGYVWFILGVISAVLGIPLSLFGCAPWYPVCVLWNRDWAHRTSIEIHERLCPYGSRPESYRCDEAYIYYTSKTNHTCRDYPRIARTPGETGQEFMSRLTSRYDTSTYIPVLSPSFGDGPCVFLTSEWSDRFTWNTELEVQAWFGLAFCFLSFVFLVSWILWVVFYCACARECARGCYHDCGCGTV